MIERYGWSQGLQDDFQPYAAQGLSPARVTVQRRGAYTLITPQGEMTSKLSGRFAHDAREGEYPVTGDWVAVTMPPDVATSPDKASATIHGVLPRRNAFTRKAAGPGRPAGQVVAANIEIAFLVTSLNADRNARRIERYLATALESGAKPVVVLTKADLCKDREAALAEIETLTRGVPVHIVSAVSGEGIEGLRDSFAPGQTAVLLGSSGVGKSSLVNALAGTERMATGGIREDDARGRHTTTHRELVLLPDGRLVLDTPGMRELGLWEAEAGVAEAFDDIEALAKTCRFGDCRHEAEPGCAVRAALADGSLDGDRWRSWIKLQHELTQPGRRPDPAARAAARKIRVQQQKDYRASKRRGDLE